MKRLQAEVGIGELVDAIEPPLEGMRKFSKRKENFAISECSSNFAVNLKKTLRMEESCNSL